MALFNKRNLIAYREMIELQKSTLFLSLVFNETEKKDVAIIYDKLIAICDTAIARNIEVDNFSFFLS